MKKQLTQLIVAVVLLAAALTAVLLLRQDNPSETEPTADETVYAMGSDKQPFVKQVEIQNSQDAFTVVNGAANAIQQQNAGATYSIPGLVTETLNQASLETVMNLAVGFPAKKVVAEAGADLSAYGLDKPQATFTAAYENGETTLLVGDPAPAGAGTYAAVGGTVYLVDTSKAEALLKSRLGFVSGQITDGSSQTSLFTRVALTGGTFGAGETVTVEQGETADADTLLGTGTYRLTSPIQTGADSTGGVTPLRGVFGLHGEVVAEAPFQGEDAWSYGLKDPYLTLEVTPQTEEGEALEPYILILSEPDAGGNVYLQHSGKDYVYLLPEAEIPFYHLTLFDLMEKLVITPNINTVSQVEVVADDMVYLFELSGEGDELAVTFSGEALDTGNFRQFYQTLLAARYDEEAPGTEQPEGEEDTADSGANSQPADPPALRFTYRYRDGSPENTVKFWPSSARRYRVALDGGAAYLVQSVYVDRVLADLPKVAAGEEVRSYL